MFFAALPSLSVSCDRLTGKLFVIDPAVYTEADGALIQRIRVAPRFSAQQTRFTVDRLQLTMDVGVGLVTGQGDDPQVMLQTSRDGGKTFGMERWRTAGPIGTYRTRVVWHRLGQARNFVPKIMLTDPVPFRISECLVDVTGGTS